MQLITPNRPAHAGGKQSAQVSGGKKKLRVEFYFNNFLMGNKGGVVDKIEADLVTIIVGREQLIFPLTKFAQNIREGDFVNLETFTVDKEETERRRRKARELLGKVFNNDLE